jgi:hypothetical protein
MSFLTGKTEKQSSVSGATESFHKALLKYLRRGIGFEGLFPSTDAIQMDLQPYRDLFTLQNTRNLAQAKEQSGNLTGSGFANVLGRTAGEAATAQGAFLADLLERRRTTDQGTFLSAILGAMGSPAAQVQYTHTPGLLDYGAQGFSAAAPYIFGNGGAASGPPKSRIP